MKIILSRKGFDSSSGGSYSPYDPITGKYMVLSILSEKTSGNEPLLKETPINGCHIGIKATSLWELLLDEKVKINPKTFQLLNEKPYVHIDPMLGESHGLQILTIKEKLSDKQERLRVHRTDGLAQEICFYFIAVFNRLRERM